MKNIFPLFFLLLFIISLPLEAQDNNRTRAETLISIALNKKEEGSSFEEVYELIRKAIEIDTLYAGSYVTWGIMLAKEAEEKKNDELRGESLQKFQKAAELSPNEKGTYYIWALVLAQFAETTKDMDLYNKSFETFSKATEIDPKLKDAYIGWGAALQSLAQENKSEQYYKESIEKYDKAIELDFNSLNAYSGKAYAYFQLGKIEKNLPKYKSQIESSYFKAEALESQSAAYNLACYYSLIKEKDKAFDWLEKTLSQNYGIRMGVLTRERIKKDKDFDNIRKDKRYKEILDRHFE